MSSFILDSNSRLEFLKLFSRFENSSYAIPASSIGALFTDLAVLTGEFLEINKQINLSAIRDPADLWRKQIYDSLLALNLDFSPSERILDWGTGGGFPGIPLGVFFHHANFPVSITLLDSVAKKINAISSFSASKLPCFDFVCERGERFLIRERFNTVLLRAVAPPDKALGWFSNNASRWVVFAGQNNHEEWLKYLPQLKAKGFSLFKTHSFSLYGENEPRFLLEFRSN